MGWQKFLMKHGVGSPGYIAGRMAKSYRTRKAGNASASERAIIHQLLVERVLGQSVLGGPAQYKFLRSNPVALDELVNQHPDLFSIVMLAIFIEHPELVGPGAPADAFDLLNETVQEALDSGAPGWRKQGVWGNATIVCSLCHREAAHPDPTLMSVAINENGKTEVLCEDCTPPLQMRAISALGFFMGR